MPVSLTTEEFHDFYDGQPGWVVLTSIGADGYPHSVPLGYFREGEHIYCGVVDGTKKIRNIEGNPKKTKKSQKTIESKTCHISYVYRTRLINKCLL